ncbi:MAG: hypothetical protein C0618_01035 [Desulfuromonas sp.]|nr:MAG: hypothetical protein C0618_01035 [Desulfuromonas sp.]
MAQYKYDKIDSKLLDGNDNKGTFQVTIEIKIISNEEVIYIGQVKVNQNENGNFPLIDSILPEILDPSSKRRIIADLKKTEL